ISLTAGSSAPGAMTSLMLSQVRFRVAGSLASAFQKLLIQSDLRVAMMSSKTARTSGAAQFGAEPAGQEQGEHPQVAVQRPQRVRKGLRPVALEDEMAEPGGGIADRRRRGEPAPIPPRQTERQRRQRRPGAAIMHRTGPPVGMPAEIKGPEFLIGHAGKPGAASTRRLSSAGRHRKSFGPAILLPEGVPSWVSGSRWSAPPAMSAARC